MQDGHKLCGISLYSPLGDYKAKELTDAHSEGAFQRVQFHVVLYEEIECLLKMRDVIRVLLGFYQHIINIDFHCASEQRAEHLRHQPLIGSPNIFQAEGITL